MSLLFILIFLILIFKPAILTLYNGLLRARVTAGY